MPERQTGHHTLTIAASPVARDELPRVGVWSVHIVEAMSHQLVAGIDVGRRGFANLNPSKQYSIMKGVVFPAVGAEPRVVDDLERPTPGTDQVLVKSIWTAINPVDTFMSASGLLVEAWPLGLGVDAAGRVVEAGSEASSKYGFNPGDEVFGCTRLGSPGYSTCQEFFLMDARVTIPRPINISLVEAATLGVASETACLGLFDGLHIPLPDPTNLPAIKDDEWVVVLGGASSVGRCAIQLAMACGYHVVASCSKNSAGIVRGLGAAPFDYKTSLEEQLKIVMDFTSGNFTKIFDAVAAEKPTLAEELFKACKGSEKFFSTTNDWSGIKDFAGGKTYAVQLGHVGRPEAEQLNAKIEQYIPVIVGLIKAGRLQPGDFEVVGEEGFEGAIKAYNLQRSGAAGARKVVIHLQETEG
ncbi:hypothetical protein HRR83_002828 [Exophiala dermatitidis]|uniref:NADPH2:quinone reductase n=2 Tax=Exophiala dermatitidis TaxID=5970 RepID=H6C103_EXODN|nr:NADPH2:quinone reductase [Exophiala dermatitidis NIH/UT8656]KAJ4516766.1 hypothetical protein HRR75_003426 [Exophiala dermatitidis]EHY57342.1 NADPH2:quinone reductase [Exophiala dermatitidis NIH/UT8656]KAJ4520739.1 hypothetical protein HRR74_003740 [Exophiala dermatitidis]KAJ4521881.1 hypothetical protein HRR73_003080 [Exophiala dermatitidis]KAJ4535868.1 hypothetical protein HRR78_008732 [Exophiala dermatitidis]